MRFNNEPEQNAQTDIFLLKFLEILTLKTSVVATELILKHESVSECQCEISK